MPFLITIRFQRTLAVDTALVSSFEHLYLYSKLYSFVESVVKMKLSFVKY